MPQQTTPSATYPAQTRREKMHALVDAWAQEIDGYPVGCLELHYAVEQVKAVLKVSVGQKKL